MNANHDGNRIPTLLGALNTDGITPINVLTNSSTHRLKTSNGTSGTNHGTVNAQRDQNRIPILIAVSAVDGVSPVEVYADSSGNLLTTTT